MSGLRRVLDLSLIAGPLHVTIVVGAIVSLAGLLALRRTRAWWLVWVPVSAAIAVVLLAALWVALAVIKPWPDALPALVWAGLGAATLGGVLLLFGWRRQRWWVRSLGIVAALSLLVGAADVADTQYGSYPTVATALQLPPPEQVSADRLTARASGGPSAVQASVRDWHPPVGLPEHGATAQVTIPGAHSGFVARAAWVYVPPAYLVANRPLLPVLVLLGGQPGGSRDWLDGGGLVEKMDTYARAHGGLAPVVVMPDALGSQFANPLCMNSKLGKSDTYLAQDVSAWVTSTLQVDPDHAHWAVGGISFGGTCALQLALSHPDLYATFFDVSGQRRPTLGSRTQTLDATFGGDEDAWNRVDPLHELMARRYPTSAGYVAVGAQDDEYRSHAWAVTAAARNAGMDITYREFPGVHSWTVWGAAFSDALPWLTMRMGLAS